MTRFAVICADATRNSTLAGWMVWFMDRLPKSEWMWHNFAAASLESICWSKPTFTV